MLLFSYTSGFFAKKNANYLWWSTWSLGIFVDLSECHTVALIYFVETWGVFGKFGVIK